MKKIAIVMSALLVFTACGDGEGRGKVDDRVKEVELEAPEMSPEEMLTEANMNGLDTKSAEYDMVFKMTGNDPQMGKIDLDMEMEMAFNMKDTSNVMFELDAEADIKAEGEDLTDQRVEFEMRFVDNTLYAIVDEITDFDGALPLEEVSDYLDKWLRVELPEEVGTEISALFDELSSESMELTTDISAFENLEYVGGAEVNGRDAYKYSFVMTGESIKGVYDEIGVDIDEVAPEVASTKVDGFVYIDKEDVLVSRMDMNFGMEMEGVEFKYEFMISVDEVNEDVRVEAPSDSEDLTPMVEGFFGMMGGFGAGLGEDMMYDTTMDGEMMGGSAMSEEEMEAMMNMTDAEFAEALGMTEEEYAEMMADIEVEAL